MCNDLQKYNLKTQEKNAHYISPENRTFNILDEDYNDEKFVKNIFKYINRDGIYRLKLITIDNINSLIQKIIYQKKNHSYSLSEIMTFKPTNQNKFNLQINIGYLFLSDQFFKDYYNYYDFCLKISESKIDSVVDIIERNTLESKFLNGKLFQNVLLYDETLQAIQI